MTGTISIKDFMQHLKKEQLVIVPAAVLEDSYVDGMLIDRYCTKILKKQWLRCSEISKGRLWGEIGRKAVYGIALKEVGSDYLLKAGGRKPIKIHRIEVLRIAKERGVER